ncbi:unnamed protein product [Moneuplotes crassus]|uniref:Uncharacterized protein n=1 Tax=Euplotes crassus TaxID=5936 RepID=A0AAD1X1J4_EUPCR|nr:unnamed protein product [Moneuplotes crassus]
MTARERFNIKLLKIRKIKKIQNVHEMRESKEQSTKITKRQKRSSLSTISGFPSTLALAAPDQKLYSRNLNLWLKLSKKRITRSFHPSKNKNAVQNKKTYFVKNGMKNSDNPEERDKIYEFLKSLSLRKSMKDPSGEQPFMTEVKDFRTSRKHKKGKSFKEIVAKVHNRVERLTETNFHKVIIDSYQNKLKNDLYKSTPKHDEEEDKESKDISESIKKCKEIIRRSKKLLPDENLKKPKRILKTSQSVQNRANQFSNNGRVYSLSPCIDRVVKDIRNDKFDKQKMLARIDKKLLHSKFPSTKFVKEDYDKFIPECFKNKILSPDSSNSSEEENPMKKLKKEEANEFYNIVRSIFNSANVSLNNEQLYSPFLEALIKNYSARLSHITKDPPNQRKIKRKESLTMTIPGESPEMKYRTAQLHLLDMRSSLEMHENRAMQDRKDRDRSNRFVHFDKNELNSKNVKKIYKNELKMRNQEKEFHYLDKLCMEVMGPQGSKEWLSHDIDFIDDVVSKKAYQAMKRRKTMDSREKQKDMELEKKEGTVYEDMLECMNTFS